MSRCVYIVADCFPPSTAVGVYRVSALCRHLAASGWRVNVITARPRAGEPVDGQMMSLVPPEVVVNSAACFDPAPVISRLAKMLRPRKAATAEGAKSGGCATPSPSGD